MLTFVTVDWLIEVKVKVKVCLPAVVVSGFITRDDREIIVCQFLLGQSVEVDSATLMVTFQTYFVLVLVLSVA